MTRDDCIAELAAAKAAPQIAQLVRSKLYAGAGVRPEQLVQAVKNVDAVWSQDLDAYLNKNDYYLRTMLGTLVASRKKIAHGQGDNVTTRRALQMHEAALDLGGWLTTRFDPRGSLSQ